jgi:competence protein ComEC
MVVAPLLRRAWIGRVDVLVASHLQADHAGAIGEILEDFDVGEVWLPDGPCDTDALRRLRVTAESRGVPLRFVSAATPRVDGVEILGPPPRAAACNDNDQSLVMAFAFGGRRVLFTGDVEAAAESRVAATADVRADVLKVPHHGSRTSSTATFLDAVKPRLAVISLGLDNHFHFPAPEVVKRYEARGTRLLRTDRDGAVHLMVGTNGEMHAEPFHAADDAEPPGEDAQVRSEVEGPSRKW